jgi:hypothetical protein
MQFNLKSTLEQQAKANLGWAKPANNPGDQIHIKSSV